MISDVALVIIAMLLGLPVMIGARLALQSILPPWALHLVLFGIGLVFGGILATVANALGL